MKPLATSQQLEDQRLKSSRIRLALAYAISMALSLCLVLAAGYWIHSALVKQSLKNELQQLAEKEAGVHLIDLKEWAAGQCHKVKQFFLKYHIITRPSGTQKDRILATKHTSLDTAYSTLAENCTKINQSA